MWTEYFSLSHSLMFAFGYFVAREFEPTIAGFLKGAAGRFFRLPKLQSQTDNEFPPTLRAAAWGDGNQEPGTVNLFADDWQIMVAEDVREDIAHEIARRWNRGSK